MNKKNYLLLKTLFIVSCTILITFPSAKLMADGDETLDLPSIPILAGSGIVIAGTGLYSQPGVIQFDVPLGATIRQVLLYWEGQWSIVSGDDAIIVEGIPITGELIGGPTNFFSSVHSSCYRADVTHLNLVAPGFNSLTISGGDFDYVSNGAGVMVIFDDGSGSADIQVRDGLDLAYIYSLEPELQSTVAQTFTYVPKDFDRVAPLAMFFSSVEGRISGGGADRPSSIEVTVDGDVTVLSNMLASLDGEEWDSLNVFIPLPTGTSSLTVQAFSRDDFGTLALPASFAWIGAFLSVPEGGHGCTPGYWKQEKHFDSWVNLLPTDSFFSAFGRIITIQWSEKGKPDDVTDPSLLQALGAKGGGINALARHAVASLLNTYSLGANFAYPPDYIIDKFNDAVKSGDPDIIEMTKDMFETANESYCPLN